MKIENRVIEVSNDKKYWNKRVLFCIKNGIAICWKNAETLKEAEKSDATISWKYWREIPKPKYRPFTWKERGLLRGRWVRSKSVKNFEYIITNLCLEKENIFKIALEDSPFMTAQKFLDSYEFIDGTPCGVPRG